jgi:hypothetical protein
MSKAAARRWGAVGLSLGAVAVLFGVLVLIPADGRSRYAGIAALLGGASLLAKGFGNMRYGKRP